MNINLCDVIEKSEIELIDNIRRDFISEDEVCATDRMIPVYDILQEWSNNKQLFYKAFGNSLDYHFPIIARMDVEEIYNKMCNKLHWINSYTYLREYIYQAIADENNMMEPVMDATNRYTTLDSRLSELYSISTLAHNAISKNRGFSFKLNGKIFSVPEGAKPMRLMGKIVRQVADKYPRLAAAYEHVRQLHSQVLNDAFLEGEMYLSIRPIDFLTASYNDCDWDSCMNIDGGDYRRGVIEMMNSPYIIEAYLPSNTPCHYGNFTFSNKKWREFFIVCEDGIFGIKGYPYWNTSLEILALNKIKELLSNVTNWTWISEEPLTWEVQYGSNNLFCDKASVVFNFECGPAMYNDFRNGLNYHGYCRGYDPNKNDFIHINYSGKSQCLYCGQSVNNHDDTWKLGCDDCLQAYTYCEFCDEIIHDDIRYFCGNIYCPTCYKERIRACPSCGDIEDIYFGEWKKIIVAPKLHEDIEYCDYPSVTVCYSCANKIGKDSYNIRFNSWSVDEIGLIGVAPENLNPKKVKLFGFDTLEELTTASERIFNSQLLEEIAS